MRSVNSLSKFYSDKVIFQNITYQFSDHGIVLLTGASGSGKTTFLRILAGLEKQTSGDVSGFSGQVSFCFQDHRLFSNLSVLENLTEISFQNATDDDIQRAKDLLLKIGFEESDFVKKPGELSGGMKQRLSFARAILYDKPVLFLDEPVKEVDKDRASVLRSILREKAKSHLILLVSHDEDDLAEFSENVIRF